MRPWRWWPTMPALIFAGIVGPGLAAEAHATPTEDAAFLDTLDGYGIAYPSPEYAINAGNVVCQVLGQGATPVEVVVILARESALTTMESAEFVGAAIGAYCQQHLVDIGITAAVGGRVG